MKEQLSEGQFGELNRRLRRGMAATGTSCWPLTLSMRGWPPSTPRNMHWRRLMEAARCAICKSG